MYQYDDYDQKLVNERVNQFRDQTERYLDGQLSDAEFLPLRLQNGLYIQRFAPMLRVAVPYGMLNSKQIRKLAQIARDYDKGYAHISTRQNVQFNWPKLEEVPDILAELAKVQMHAIQTSGNCIRNTTTDHFAGVAYDEVIDPRPWCEIVRQWSTFHPEFAYLPRKFKIAVNGAKNDRAAIYVHDIGLQVIHNEAGDIGFTVIVGGGLGRTPVIGSVINEFLPWQDLLTYLDAVLRVYNLYGRRDNKYKSRIKILVKALTAEVFAQKVAEHWQITKKTGKTLTDADLQRVAKHFTNPNYLNLADEDFADLDILNPTFANWRKHNCFRHKKTGYICVTLSLKAAGNAPGDISDTALDAVADLADKYSFGEARNSHKQNIILADVEQRKLFDLWQELLIHNLATPNIGLLTDVICCPGGDFCSLANAKSLIIADEISRKFQQKELEHLGKIDLNISGCMNACGHHHVGNIGILGVDKKGAEFYQIAIGGNAGNFLTKLSDYENPTVSNQEQQPKIAQILGPSFAQDEISDVIDKLIRVYLTNRQNTDESFLDTVQRIGINPFKEQVYESKK